MAMSYSRLTQCQQCLGVFSDPASRPRRGWHAGRHHVGEQFVLAGLELSHIAGHHHASAAGLGQSSSQFAQPDFGQPARQLIRGPLSDVLGLYYTPPGAVYLYLNVTGTIFLAGAFVCVIGGLYWKRANVMGGYLAMFMGAVGVIVPFFFLHWNENVTGFTAFALRRLD